MDNNRLEIPSMFPHVKCNIFLVLRRVVDWRIFFDSQIPKDSNIESNELSAEEEFKMLVQNRALKSRPSSGLLENDEKIVSLFGNAIDTDLQLIPLPFGQIESRIIIPYEKVVFHVELPNFHTLLTIQIECLMGGVELLLSRDSIPSFNSYDYRGRCPVPSPSNSKVLRVTFPLIGNTQSTTMRSSVPYFIMVIGEENGAHAKIWAGASCPPAENEDVVNKVTSLQMLSEYSLKNLVSNFEKLHDETRNMVSRKVSTPANFLPPLYTLSNSSGGDSTSESDDDTSRFIQKSGVILLQKHAESRGEDVDPNLNIDLFHRATLRSRVNDDSLDGANEKGVVDSITDSGDMMDALEVRLAYNAALGRLASSSFMKTGPSVNAIKRKPYHIAPLRYTLSSRARGFDRRKTPVNHAMGK